MYSDRMAPWDELRFYDLPTETRYSAPAVGTQIAKGNPMRVALIFANTGNAICLATTNPNATALAPQGIAFGLNAQTLQLTQAALGNLVAQPWYMGNAPGGGNVVVVIEVILHEWPNNPSVQPINGRTLQRNGRRSTSNPIGPRIGTSLRGLWDAISGLRDTAP